MIVDQASLRMIILLIGLTLINMAYALPNVENNITAEDIFNNTRDRILDFEGLSNVKNPENSENWFVDELDYVEYKAYYSKIKSDPDLNKTTSIAEEMQYAIKITLSSEHAIIDVKLYKNNKKTNFIPIAFWKRAEEKLANWIEEENATAI